ncbi:unnamed protein product [Citrullus colocynthis]|uniref:Uncharacterized protein n=1 Tax=Citrullus colocynthis TaxID=252529 RepID=A0ABP0Y839_9ROSI
MGLDHQSDTCHHQWNLETEEAFSREFLPPEVVEESPILNAEFPVASSATANFRRSGLLLRLCSFFLLLFCQALLGSQFLVQGGSGSLNSLQFDFGSVTVQRMRYTSWSVLCFSEGKNKS